MLGRLRDILKFRIERLLLRGAGLRLLFVALIIGAMSLVCGLIVAGLDNDFEHTGSAVWWAFLRLTDPGYLGDDQGLGRRIVSTFLTVAGYVLFMGALVAILTQWLNEAMRDLEAGYTPIVQSDHVLVVGSTTRTATIVAEMLTMADRVQRFLALHETKRINLVVLLDELTSQTRQDLRERVGSVWHEGRVVLRSGTPLRIEHLKRVDFLRASAILLPAEVLDETESESDTRTIKTLVSMSRYSDIRPAELPLVVTEVFDARKIQVARRAYRGPVEVVASDQLVARLLALCILYPGMSQVLSELLMYGEGNEVHVQDPGDLVGMTVAAARQCFPRGIFLGLVKRAPDGFRSRLLPRDDMLITDEHALIVLARSHEDAAPGEVVDWPEVDVPEPEVAGPAAPRRVLVLGWSDRVPDLVAELTAHKKPMSIDVLSSVPAAERERILDYNDLGHCAVHNLLGDVTSPKVIEQQDLAGYDVVVFMASDRLHSGAQSDARTILSYLLVRHALEKCDRTPRLIVELMDSHNEALVDARDVEVLVSSLIIGRVLAHVALRPELRAAYDDLFSVGRAVLTVKPATAFVPVDSDLRFDELCAVAHTRGDTMLGLIDERGPQLNLRRDQRVIITEDLSFVLIEYD